MDFEKKDKINDLSETFFSKPIAAQKDTHLLSDRSTGKIVVRSACGYRLDDLTTVGVSHELGTADLCFSFQEIVRRSAPTSIRWK